jgi:hypothetical protein
MTTTIAAPTVIERAELTLREVMHANWPAGREAMAAIGYASGYAAECIEIHTRLRYGRMDWQDYDADLTFFGGNPQREAIAIAADKALKAAKAALARLREHQQYEQIAAELGTKGGQ